MGCRRAGLRGKAVRLAVLAGMSSLASLVGARASAEVPSGGEEPLLPGPGPGVEAPPAPPPDAAARPAGDAEVPPGDSTEAPPLAVPVRLPEEVDRWPIEYVRRPQTLPGGMIGVSMGLSGFKPDALTFVNQTTGDTYRFHSFVNAGVGVDVGVTDLSAISLSLPRALCFDGGQPSGCSPNNRYNGTGLGVEIGLVRAPNVQLAVSTGISIGVSSPVIFRWTLAANLRARVLSWLVLRTSVEIVQYANPPAGVANPLIAYLSGVADVQVTRRLLLFGHVVPWGSVGDVGEGIELEIHGGASLSFTNRVQLSLDVGKDNLLSRPAWSPYIPGAFADLELIVWRG